MLSMCTAGSVEPLIVLTKSDLANEQTVEQRRAELCEVAPSVGVLAVSVKSGDGLSALRGRFRDSATVCLLGKSGVGKSALLNALAPTAVAREGEVRGTDSRGRHTTSSSRMYGVEADGKRLHLIDLPGLRELSVRAESEEVTEAFADIAERAPECRFRDCTHRGEMGCAVIAAVAAGEIARDRYERYLDQIRDGTRNRRREKRGPKRHRHK
ncbi:MAG: ribosome small subunit-dependent GTPase A, partial [Spirochaetia bacterium]